MRKFVSSLKLILTRTALLAVAALAMASFLNSGEARAQQAGATSSTATGSSQAVAGSMARGTPVAATFSASAPSLSPEQRAAFEAAFAKSHRSGPINLPHAAMKADGPAGPAQELRSLAAPKAAIDLFLHDRLVAPSGAPFSAVGEPSGDNAGNNRFQSGNWYAAASFNAGATFNFVNPFTMFGSGFCCDQVVVYDPGRNAWFWLLQYGDHLVLANSRDLVNWCSYTWTPASFGFSGSLDYNDLALTTNNIYIVSNVFPASGGSGSVVARLPIDPQLTCSGFNYIYFNRTDLGFTWKPVSGATDVLYWGTNWFGTLGSSFRVFKWAENSGTIFWFDRTLGTTFAFFTRNSGQNCGSQDGVVKNWCQFADSRVVGGARYSDPNGTAQLVFSFNAKQGGPFSLPFPYTERVHFQESDFSYIGSDRIFSTGVAFQFTSLATDARGHIGMTTLFGGGTGTSHTFPSGWINLNDDVSPNQPWAGTANAFGAGNPCLNGTLYRSGDFLTTRAYRPTNTLFLGYNFVLTADAGSCGSTAPVAAHEVVFGRKRDKHGGFQRWQ
ncbi:MAG: hypothetical protein ACREDM_08930 [Methylocella sp.]